MEIIFLLTLLLIKHFIVDFVIQYPFMIREKGTYCALGGILHAWLHGLGTFLAVTWFAPTLLLAIKVAVVDFLIHYHVDWAKMNLSKNYTTADQKFWVWMGLDQLLHGLTYLLIAYIILI
jgi:hypothetical protein